MDDQQIEFYLKKMNAISKCKGIYCIDEFNADLIETGHFVILNTLPKANFEKKKNGHKEKISGHWILLLAGKDLNDANTPVYFDPIGLLPQNLDFVMNLLNCKTTWLYNNVSLQSLFSELCGYHVLYVVFFWVKRGKAP